MISSGTKSRRRPSLRDRGSCHWRCGHHDSLSFFFLCVWASVFHTLRKIGKHALVCHFEASVLVPLDGSANGSAEEITSVRYSHVNSQSSKCARMFLLAEWSHVLVFFKYGKKMNTRQCETFIKPYTNHLTYVQVYVHLHVCMCRTGFFYSFFFPDLSHVYWIFFLMSCVDNATWMHTCLPTGCRLLHTLWLGLRANPVGLKACLNREQAHHIRLLPVWTSDFKCTPVCSTHTFSTRILSPPHTQRSNDL